MVKINSKYILLFIFLFITSLFYSSCILPVYKPSPDRGLIDTSFVKLGVTTKEKIFLAFGYTFRVSEDEKLFTLYYSKGGEFSWAIIGGAVGGYEFGKQQVFDRYEVEIQFDENDIVKRCETFKLPRERSLEKSKPKSSVTDSEGHRI